MIPQSPPALVNLQLPKALHLFTAAIPSLLELTVIDIIGGLCVACIVGLLAHQAVSRD